jgi:hypothetical protein
MRTLKKPRFSLPHIVLTFLLLDKSSRGRYSLANYLGISLAQTRSLLKLLVDKSLAQTAGKSSGKKGTSLTHEGRVLVKQIKQHMELITDTRSYSLPKNIIPQGRQVCLVLLNSVNIDTKGLYERDIAVSKGAEGAITLIRRSRSWVFPDSPDYVMNDFLFTQKELQITDFTMAILVFSQHLGDSCVAAAEVAFYHLEDSIRNIFSTEIVG